MGTEGVMAPAPVYLRTEYQFDPLGLDETEPRFSWLVENDHRGAYQSSYQVLVASSIERLDADAADLWDSGKVESDATAHVVYAGAPLRAFSRANWKVRVWDEGGGVSPWSQPARFEIGPLAIDDWTLGTGGRIGATLIYSSVVGDANTSAPAPYMRRSFDVDGRVMSARLYITALGLYEASINGHLVTDDVYRPGWTDYHLRVPYQAYDVTTLLRQGENVLGAILGDGWFCGFVDDHRQHWGDRPKLLAKLVVELDGADAPFLLGTDGKWRTTTGPILVGDNYDGETYDARLELPGWDEPGYDDGGWEPVQRIGRSLSGRAQIVGTTAPPVRRVLELKPTSLTKRADEVCQFDLGQNMVGRVRLRVNAPRGTEITLQFAEILNADGSLHTDNLGTAKATDHYICKGGGEEVYEPRFTFHGFRYVEVTGAAGLDETAVTGVVLHSDARVGGHFSCSNELVNRLQQNIQWSQRGNFLDVPTDCPQRNERLGWTGDIQIFARTATFNMDAAAFLSKYVHDLQDAQLMAGIERGAYPIVVPSIAPRAGGPAWADAGVVVPWVLYERYGDLRLLERHYTSMLDYADFLDRVSRGRAEGTWLGYGDWVSLDAVAQHIDGFGIDDRFGGTPRDYIWRAFDIYSTNLTARMATLLGRDADATRLTRRRDVERDAFAERWVGDDGSLTVTTQTAYLLALHFDLLTDAGHRAAAVEDLVANIEATGHLQTGFIGTPYLLHVLSNVGRADLAYRLLERTEYPSWLYEVTQGATTIWERWDAWTKESGFNQSTMNSFNHYAYGAVGEWLFRVAAGIDTAIEGAGYREVRFRPELGGTLTHVSAHVETLVGRVASSWRLEGGRATLRLTLPWNTRGRFRLPAASLDRVSENGVALEGVNGISNARVVDGRVECDAVAGTYELLVDDPILASGQVLGAASSLVAAHRSSR
jgi:alpha-L-rhamnosidase